MGKKIIVIVNNYSYFQSAQISGPKSFIQMLSLLKSILNLEIKLFINTSRNQLKIGDFPVNVIIETYTNNIDLFTKLIRDRDQCVAYIFDRSNIVIPLITSKLFGIKSILRLLGRAQRLNSKNLLSYRNLIKIITFIFPVNLVIETNDGSRHLKDNMVCADIYKYRVNGVDSVIFNRADKKDTNLFMTAARFSTEKNIVNVINNFQIIRDSLTESKLNIFGCKEKDVLNLVPKINLNGCTFHGFVSREIIFDYLRKSMFFITGNDIGLLGNAELEALHFDCTIIHSRYDLVENLPDKYKSGYIHFSDLDLKSYQAKFPNGITPHCFKQVHLDDIMEIAKIL